MLYRHKAQKVRNLLSEDRLLCFSLVESMLSLQLLLRLCQNKWYDLRDARSSLLDGNANAASPTPSACCCVAIRLLHGQFQMLAVISAHLTRLHACTYAIVQRSGYSCFIV